MDPRGQGATARRAGATADPAGGTTAQAPGFLTRGVLDPADYYYRRVFTDAALAGGVSAALVDVPFLCHFSRAVEITERAPHEDCRPSCARTATRPEGRSRRCATSTA
ncbi:acetylxylan esterase [Microbispora siamensis]